MKRMPKNMPMQSMMSAGMWQVLGMGGMTPKPKPIFAQPMNNLFDFVLLMDLEVM